VWSAWLAFVVVTAAIPAAAQNVPGPASRQMDHMQKLMAAEAAVAKQEAAMGRSFGKEFRDQVNKGLAKKTLSEIDSIPQGGAIAAAEIGLLRVSARNSKWSLSVIRLT
jgi:hypothetical protein